MKSDEIIGFSFLSIPIFRRGWRRARGRLLPWGWYHILRDKKRTRWARREWDCRRPPLTQGLGASIVLYAEVAITLKNSRFEFIDVVQVKEENQKSRSALEELGVTWHKRHRELLASALKMKLTREESAVTQDPRERIPRRTKILYGAGDIGFSLTGTIIGVLFAIYLTDVVGLGPGSAAAAPVILAKSWDYVNDPLIGYISDRTRTRWGRRRPFLLFGFLPFALAFMALWWKPPIPNRRWPGQLLCGRLLGLRCGVYVRLYALLRLDSRANAGLR